MKTELKESLLKYINNILHLKCWENISEPIIFDKSKKYYSKTLIDYFSNDSLLINSKKNKNLSLLIKTLEAFDEALDEDWLPNNIINLSVPTEAYLFLKEIKNILEEDIDNNEIENELIKRYNKIKNQHNKK